MTNYWDFLGTFLLTLSTFWAWLKSQSVKHMNNTKAEVSQSWDVSCFLLLSFRWIVTSYWCRVSTLVKSCVYVYIYMTYCIHHAGISWTNHLKAFSHSIMPCVVHAKVPPLHCETGVCFGAWTYIRGWKMGTMVSSMWSFVFRTTMFAIHLPPKSTKARQTNPGHGLTTHRRDSKDGFQGYHGIPNIGCKVVPRFRMAKFVEFNRLSGGLCWVYGRYWFMDLIHQ